MWGKGFIKLIMVKQQTKSFVCLIAINTSYLSLTMRSMNVPQNT